MPQVLSGGTLVDPTVGLVERRDLIVDGGRIGGSVGSAPRVDVSGCLVMPGNVCSHHHLYSTLARGMPGPTPPPRNFVEILERIWWRVDRALDPVTIELSAALGSVEAVRSGTTSLVDHHASPEAIDSSLDALASGIEAAGVRGVVCYEVTDRHGEERGRAAVAENERFLRTNARPLIRGMVGAHASFTIGSPTMERVVGAARDLGAPIHIHVAEDAADERDSLDRFGKRTAHRLSEEGALAEGDLVAHGVHLDDSEIEAVRSSGAWVAHNPRSNLNNGVGYAPALRLGERVGLGTDGIDGDMFAEAKVAYLKAREATLEAGPDWALSRLTAGSGVMGAVFGEPAFGRLEVGAPADLVVLDYPAPTPLTGSNLAGHFLFGLGSRFVRDVMVAGEWVVRDRRHQLVDEDELAARCGEAAPKLWERMERY
jgi:putative selenium metabolism protein SsnA